MTLSLSCLVTLKKDTWWHESRGDVAYNGETTSRNHKSRHLLHHRVGGETNGNKWGKGKNYPK